jgi:hypothetical protein
MARAAVLSPSVSSMSALGRTLPRHFTRGAAALTQDCVAKLFFGVRANFSRGAGAFARKLCRGSHNQSDFQPAAFVSSLHGIVSPKIHFDGQAVAAESLFYDRLL